MESCFCGGRSRPGLINLILIAMDIKKIIELEKSNPNKIYLYRNTEEGYCKAYEFSAYLATKFLSSLKLEEEPVLEVYDMLFTVKTNTQFILDHFSSFGIEEIDDCIQISLYDLTHSIKWRNEFNKLKEQQREKHSELGNFVLGISRLGNSK